MNAPTTTTTTAPVQFFTYAELMKPEHKKQRQAFGLPTVKDLRAALADLVYTDPDYLRTPDGQTIRFVEVGGIVGTAEPLTDAQAAIISAFLADDFAAHFKKIGGSWAQFGGAPTEQAAPHPCHRIAYRGGSGTFYGLFEHRTR